MTELDASQLKDPEFWRLPNRCGINCLYVYLALTNHETRYSSILDALPVSKEGVSLAQLRDASNKFGCPLTAIRTTPEGIESLLPAIVHFDEERGVTGHYCVMLSTDGANVTLIDGTSGALQLTPRSDFEKRWSGFALVDSSKTGRLNIPVMLAVACVAAAGVWFFVRGTGTLRRQPRTPDG